MRVLVIGGTRYLGRAIVQRLAARGDEVTVANRGQTASDLPLGVAQVTCDIDEPGSLPAALEGLDFDAAVHMIAMNGTRARTVLEDLRGRIGHYVQCGSTGVYMPLQVVPADEDHPVDPPSERPGRDFQGLGRRDHLQPAWRRAPSDPAGGHNRTPARPVGLPRQ